ncbi:hypothetical protein ACFY0P_50185 [Streptomyces sp. NPDC001714]|uniref:hypothetical protein n=1 Tax=Streptomyces sp. NPDC001714 TaxID=3364603 RepID=UPI0036C97C2D
MSHRDDTPVQESAGQSRRGFLRSTAPAGAGAAAGGTGAAVLGATPASAAEATGSAEAGAWRPGPNALRFTLAVMPDAQSLYRGSQDSVNRTPQEASSLGLPWLAGGHAYAGAVDMVFHGSAGDIRIANRPPAAEEFLAAR